MRRIFDDYVAGGHSTREITRRLNADSVPTPTGKRAVWGTSTIGRLLRNEAYVGRVYYNRTEAVPDPRARTLHPPSVPAPRRLDRHPSPAHHQRRHLRSGQPNQRGTTPNGVPATSESTKPGCFERWSAAAPAESGVSCHKMRGRDGTIHRYYYCRNHDPLRAGGEQRRCRERNIRADALDAFVFDQVREAAHSDPTCSSPAKTPSAPGPRPRRRTPRQATGPAPAPGRRRRSRTTTAGRPLPGRDDRTSSNSNAEPKNSTAAADTIEEQHQALTDQRGALAKDNRLRHRIGAFAETVIAALDDLNFADRQKLLRLIIEEVRVTGWDVEIRLRIPLDDPPPTQPPGPSPPKGRGRPRPVSSQDRLRSLGGHRR